MRSAGQPQRRWFMALLYASLGVLLNACGGGSDEAAPESSSSARVLEPVASSSQAHKRRALSFERKGVTAIGVAHDGNAIGVATSDGRVRVLDASGAREIRVLKPQGGAAAAGLIFSADDRYLVTVG